MNNYTESRIREFILDDHPCIMAHSLVADDSLIIKEYSAMFDKEVQQTLSDDLFEYISRQDPDSKDFESLIAVFKNDKFLDEQSFENAFWKLLIDLHNIDSAAWDASTSKDPQERNFSFSLHGSSFYLVGMHPNSSRFARKAPYTMIVFNLHAQFEKLREINRYDRIRDLIRSRDKAYHGNVNPMLADFGTESEAKQYSGRMVEKNWECPYKFE